ncbi:beta-glucosidase [Rubrivirga sp.]|uniref:beta-glucosidase n=1 Tax=Rubrivirga sp. TaxID=1885344 RepID=UPI003B52107A
MRRARTDAPRPDVPEGADASPFASFWQGGWECSSHRRLADRRRVDVIAATRHDRWAARDYRALAELGIRTVRDGLRWPLVEATAGRYDWGSWLRQLRAARETGTQVVWDLCHYGVPDGLDVWRPAFVDRFAAFARAAARVHRDETDTVPWWCPVNELSFWSWAGGDQALFPPFAEGRSFELKVQLARAALAAADAVREVDPRARLLWAEPVVHVVPRTPRQAGHAEGYRQAQFQAFDLLAGRLWPQIGGDEGVLDVLGLNYYPQNQWVYEGEALPPRSPRRRPFRAMLAEVWDRYRRPLVVSETGTEGDDRPRWLARVAGEVEAARADGVPVHGLCWYPIADHPGWEDDRPCPNGLLGVPDADGGRPVHAGLAAELARWQRRMP